MNSNLEDILEGDDDELNLSKDETEVAKNLRFNLQTKKAALFGDQVFYFSGESAVNFLLDSKWATGTTKSSVQFTHRESAADFLQKMLNCGMFSRVHLIKTEKKIKKKEGSEKEKKNEEATDEKKTDDKKDQKAPSSPKAKKDNKEVKRVKKKVKITLEVHEYQEFLDAEDEYYVWIYDPISWKTFILGILLVLGVVAVCLFPLWPESVREYSWYLSVAGAVFVGGIIVLAILRYVIYGILWLATMGKLHFWLLPNLTAECGFFESFVPAYEYTVYNKDQSKGKEDEKGKRRDSGVSSDEKRRDSGTPSDEKQHDSGAPSDDKRRDSGTPSLDAEDKKQSGSEGSGKENGDWVKVKKDDVMMN